MSGRRKLDCIGDYCYDKKDILGHGAFAIVFKGCKKHDHSVPVAVKCVAKKELGKSKELLAKEINVLRELSVYQHDNVVALLDVKESDTSVFLMMEYCNGGDLSEYLQSKGTISEDALSSFMQQIASALNALNDKGIVHRDIKPQNILLCYGKGANRMSTAPTQLQLKIADFGFARFLEEGKMAGTLCGSPMYMAPEVIMSHKYDSKADLWSVGTIIFQCLAGKAPFPATTPQALRSFYEKNIDLKPRFPENTSPDLRDVLVRLLTRDAAKRIAIKDLLQHPFLQRWGENLSHSKHSSIYTSPISPPLGRRQSMSPYNSTEGSSRRASCSWKHDVNMSGTLTMSKSNGDDEEDGGFTKVEQPDARPHTPEDFVLLPKLSDSHGKDLMADDLHYMPSTERALSALPAPSSSHYTMSTSRAPLALVECDMIDNGVSSRLVNSSCEHPENAQALFWKKASPEWSQVDQVVSRKPLGDTAALVVASTAHSEDTTIDSPNPAGNTLAPTITNAGGAVDQHQQQPPPSMPSSTVHHRISSAPIPVPTLKRAAHLSHHPCSDLPLSECSSPYVDRGSYFARANFKEETRSRRYSESALLAPDITHVSPPKVLFSIGTPQSMGKWKWSTPNWCRFRASSHSPGHNSPSDLHSMDTCRSQPPDYSAPTSPAACHKQFGSGRAFSANSPVSDGPTVTYHPICQYHCCLSCSSCHRHTADVACFPRHSTVPDFSALHGDTCHQVASHCTSPSYCSGFLHGDELSNLGLHHCLRRHRTESELLPQCCFCSTAQHHHHHHCRDLHCCFSHCSFGQRYCSSGLPIMEQGNTENMCCHSDRVRHSSCGRIQHISPALPENVSSGHGEKCAYLPSDKTSPTPHDFTNATSPLPNVMPVHFLTSFNLLTTELSEDTLISDDHKQNMARLCFILQLAKCIVELARSRTAVGGAMPNCVSLHCADRLQFSKLTRFSQSQMLLEQVILYLRTLQILAQSVSLAETELKEKRLHCVPSLKTVLEQLNHLYRVCVLECQQLYSRLVHQCQTPITSQLVISTADKLIYNFAVEQCQTAALDELAGNTDQCLQRYTTAHVLLYSLAQTVPDNSDRRLLEKYRHNIEERLCEMQVDSGLPPQHHCRHHHLCHPC